MSKFSILILHEYRKAVFRKGFLLALFSVPIWILVTLIFAIIAAVLANDSTAIGYVDHSGLLAHPAPLPEEISFLKPPEIIKYPDENAARASLEQKKIQVYYVLPETYPAQRNVKAYYLKQPKDRITQRFEAFLQVNLIQNLPARVSNRLALGSSFGLKVTQDQSENGNNRLFRIATPIFGAILLITSVFTSSGYLMKAVVDEKENRTMEILATSLSPEQIMGGKVLALIGVGLTQVVMWSGFALAGILVGRSTISFFQGIVIEWGTVALVLALVLPTLVMMAAFMAAIGSTVTEASEGQQVSSLVTLLFMLPFMLIGLIMSNPNGLVSMILSFFPLTSSMTILIRSAFGTVPTWQIILSAGLLIVYAILSLWFAGRIFRVGMLRYGKRLAWKEIFGTLRRKVIE